MRIAFCSTLAACLVLAAAGTAGADDRADMIKLLDKATKALGGKANLAKYTGFTCKGKGTIQAGDNKVAFTEESYWQMPGQFRFDLELDISGNKINEKIVINGTKGWIQFNSQKAIVLPKKPFTAFTDVFYAVQLAMKPLEAKGKKFKLSPLGEIKIDNRAALGVQITLKGKPDVNLYFDKEKGLPLRAELRSLDPELGNQEVAHELLFTGYKKVGGLTTYTTLTWNKDSKKYVVREMTEIKPEEKLDADLFAKP